MNIREIVAGNIKGWREASGYTQAHVAEACGFEVPSYSRWENAKAWPSPDTINRLALFYHCSPAEFYKIKGTHKDLSTSEVAEIAENAPWPKLLEIVFAKIKAIPEDVVEMAYYGKFPEDFWDKVRVLIRDQQRSIMQENIKNRKPSRFNIREYRQKTLEYLKTDNKDVLQEISQLLEDAGPDLQPIRDVVAEEMKRKSGKDNDGV